MIQPEDIMNEIRKRPPAQRIDAGKNYIGLEVSWKLDFLNARADYNNNDILRVHAFRQPSSGRLTSVSFNAEKKKYPELNILNEDEHLWVKGKIEKVDPSFGIDLKMESLRFQEGEPAQAASSITNVYNNQQIHNGQGDNVKGDKIINNNPASVGSFWGTLWGQIIIGLIVAGVVALIALLIK